LAGVYSRRLLQSGDCPTNPEYTVPDGFVAVIRSVDLIAFVGGETLAVVAINGLRFFGAVFNDGAYGFGAAHWEGRQVMNAGDVLSAGASGTYITVTASGYLLSA